jgi:hypothetical protein
METYYRLKRGVSQIIRIEKVEVQSGGQAIVGVIDRPVQEMPSSQMTVTTGAHSSTSKISVSFECVLTFADQRGETTRVRAAPFPVRHRHRVVAHNRRTREIL